MSRAPIAPVQLTCRSSHQHQKVIPGPANRLFDLSVFNPDQLAKLARACGATLAHAHARTGNRFAIAAYLGNSDEFDRQLDKFARAYAKQNDADYALFLQAREAGEL